MNKAITATAILLFAIAPFLGAAVAVDEKIIDAGGVRELVVDNVNGRIEVAGTNRSDILIRASKSADSAARLEDLSFTAVAGPDGRLTVETKHVRTYLWGIFPLKVGGRIDYRIEVPSGLRVSLSTVNGDILATGVGGDLKADAVNGNIKVEVLEGKADVESVNGALHFSVKASAPRVNAETVNGAITLRLEPGSGLRYDLETVSGRIRFVPERVKVKGGGPMAIEGTLGDGAGMVKAETVNGDILVHLGEAEAI